jgi:hypothetical protein
MSAKSRKDIPDPFQMDFLAAIPEPPKPMLPIGPGPDGTPALPLINSAITEPTPAQPDMIQEPDTGSRETTSSGDEEASMTNDVKHDVFYSDPFFNPDPATQPSSGASEPDLEEIPPVQTSPPDSITTPPQEASAEERLLNTIVGDTTDTAPADAPPSGADDIITTLKHELETARKENQKAREARERLQQDFHILRPAFPLWSQTSPLHGQKRGKPIN